MNSSSEALLLHNNHTITGPGAKSELVQRLGDRQACGPDGRQESTNEADDQRGDNALHEQITGDGKIEHDLAKARTVELGYLKAVEWEQTIQD